MRGDYTRAASLEGYADAVFRRCGFERGFTESTTHDRLGALLDDHVAAVELARLHEAGASLTVEGAEALALEP